MMATAIQKNGMQPLTNGVVNHIENQLNESEVCPVKQEDVDIYGQGRYPADQEENDDTKEIDIYINNVVCSFSVRCHLNLRQIALHGCNVVYRRENGVCLLFIFSVFLSLSLRFFFIFWLFSFKSVLSIKYIFNVYIIIVYLSLSFLLFIFWFLYFNKFTICKMYFQCLHYIVYIYIDLDRLYIDEILFF